MSPEEARGYGIIDEVYAAPDKSLISEAKSKGMLGGEGAAAAEEAAEESDGPRPAKG
jgi:hypothetical protein